MLAIPPFLEQIGEGLDEVLKALVLGLELVHFMGLLNALFLVVLPHEIVGLNGVLIDPGGCRLSLGIVISLTLVLIQVDGGVLFGGQWELSLDYFSQLCGLSKEHELESLQILLLSPVERVLLP